MEPQKWFPCQNNSVSVCAQAFRDPKLPWTAPIPNFRWEPGAAAKSPTISHWIHVKCHTRSYWIPLKFPKFSRFSPTRPIHQFPEILENQGARGNHIISHNSGTNHKNCEAWKTFALKDMRWSEFPWRGNFWDKSQKCFGPGISDFPNTFHDSSALVGQKVGDRWAANKRLRHQTKTTDQGTCDHDKGQTSAIWGHHCIFWI